MTGNFQPCLFGVPQPRLEQQEPVLWVQWMFWGPWEFLVRWVSWVQSVLREWSFF